MVSERDMPQPGFLDTILTRRSVREFKPDPIPVELLQKLMQAAQAASARGGQVYDGR